MSREIILDKFEEWSRAKGSKEARMEIFQQIRDIPYYLVPQIDDPYDWAASVLSNNRGSCSPKHYLLGLLFSRMGIAVKYVTYPFKWGAQPIKYPADLKELASASPIAYHVACKAYINDKWVLVDATYDLPLREAGFPVTSYWNGDNDTICAVLPLDEIIHDTLEARLDFVKSKKSLYSEQDKAVYAQFIEKFNVWLSSLRR